MLSPFLLVGVGGSGGKTLRVIRDNLSRRLAQAGWEGDIPKAWQFVHIDVPTIADGNDSDLPPQLPERDYQGMVGQGLDYRSIDAAMTQSVGSLGVDALGGWRPDPNRVNIPAAKGAGQFRALGRVITVAGLNSVRDALAHARREITGAEVVGELQKVTEILGGKPGAIAHDPTVILVTSIAGGTGSGAFIDVCDAIRALGDNWASEIVGILYAPDVFDYLPEEARKGVRPNALAAISELLSGFWNESGATDGTTQLFAKYGIQLAAEKRLGPRYPFLVGARNEHVTYKTQNDIYLAMGRSLASWVSSVSLQDRLSAYTQAQFSSSALAVPDKLPLHIPGTETPFTALGSARVGLGRDRFQDYAAEHLARTVVDRFLRQHETSRAKGDERTEKQVIKDLADDVFGGFLVSSKLHERGEENNQIIDSFVPDDLETSLRSVYTETLTKIRATIPEKGARAGDVRRSIRNLVNDRHSSFRNEQLSLRIEKGKEWIASIQLHLPSLAAKYIALVGAPVTMELLKRLATEVKQVRDELRQEASARRRWASDIDQMVRGALDDQDTAVILRTTDRLEEAVKRAVQTLQFEQEAEIRELAAELIPDLADNMLRPLIDAIQHAIESLSGDRASGNGGRQSAIALWPVGDSIPERLRPAPNEFLLEPATSYFELLQELVRRTIGVEAASEARVHAEQEILLNTDDLEGLANKLILSDRKWAPKNHQLNSSMAAAPARAVFSVKSSAESVIERSRAWLNRSGTHIGKYMAEGLRDYLNPDTVGPADLEKRLQQFSAQLTAALNAGAPLVSINTSVLVQVHSRNEVTYSRSFSEIPLPEKSPAREIVRKTLEARGEWTDAIAKSFSDGNGADIDIFTVLSEPYEPVVFNSLMGPIASEWGARNKTPEQRAEFWRWRRARPLTEALPFSPAILEYMVRGWFVARLLDQIRATDDKVDIFVPSEIGAGGDFAAFPSPLLTSVRLGPDLLPALLESVTLAMLEVNTSESLVPMRPYARLRTLGQGGVDELPTELEAWIRHGDNAMGGTPEGTQETRQAKCLETLDAYIANFSHHFAKIASRTELLDFPGSYELRHEINSMLGSLRRATESMPVKVDGEFF